VRRLPKSCLKALIAPCMRRLMSSRSKVVAIV
jgi:hypothetical protein